MPRSSVIYFCLYHWEKKKETHQLAVHMFTTRPLPYTVRRNNILSPHLSRRALRRTPAGHSRPFRSHAVPAVSRRRKCPHRGTARAAEGSGSLVRRTHTSTRVRRWTAAAEVRKCADRAGLLPPGRRPDRRKASSAMGVGCPCLNPGPTSSLMLTAIHRRVWRMRTRTMLPQYQSFQHMCEHPKHRFARYPWEEAVRSCPT
ncbi:hypothetical protein EDB87DRAFT_4036 [Lactarius vividus]|nr:hypothetical protein EDB87DRAFT_4036 [Lactarius vividus]